MNRLPVWGKGEKNREEPLLAIFSPFPQRVCSQASIFTLDTVSLSPLKLNNDGIFVDFS